MTTEPTPAANPSTAITETPAAPPATGSSTAITETPAPAVPPAPTVVDAPPAPPTPAGPPLWPFRVDVTILVLLLVLTFLISSFAIGNSDLWLHLAIGKRYSDGKFGFGVDPFSWTTDGVYWVHHSWLYSWLVYGIYSLFGGTGLVISKAIVFTAAIGILARIGWTESNRWFTLIFLVMAALAASRSTLMQPIVLSMLFLAITLFILQRVGLFAVKRVEEGPLLEPNRAPTEKTPPATSLQGAGGELSFGSPGDVRLLWCLPPLFALWANLDSWFILGPILVALCWAAVGLSKWFPSAVTVPGKTLGIVVGVGLLACMVNPHHVRVFQLPPELGYLVVTLTDPVGIPLPNALVGAGRTFRELSQADPTAIWTISPLSPTYWKNPLGLHAAGLAAAPLLLVGLLSFTLVALIGPKPGAPTLGANRFLLWLAFAVPALALYRMIPFFALVAAPLTAMTLGEYLLWWQSVNDVPVERRERGLQLARILSVPFLLVLLGLAWPGWLHGTTPGNEWNSPRRVAWTMRPDSSLQRAAETLQDLKEKNECHNVFNASYELGNYMPWFAPDVKYFWDTRAGLFAGKAPLYKKTRDALLASAVERDEFDWRGLFGQHDVDHVAMANLLTMPNESSLPVKKWWDEGEHWRERYLDGRVGVFSWSGAGKTWPLTQAIEDLNRRAFGEVPASKRPPASGIEPVDRLGTWLHYRDGLRGRPSLIGECEGYLRSYQLKRLLQPFHCMPQPFSTCSFIVACAAPAGLQPMPGGGMTLGPTMAIMADQYKPLDGGPPALPILLVRTARRAVAENPHDAFSHIALADAHDAIRRMQEEHWTSLYGHSDMRSRLRQFQTVSGYYTAVQLQPDHLDANRRLARFYLERGIFDIALEHEMLALKFLEERAAASREPKKFEQALKNFETQEIRPLAETVRLRQATYRTETEGKSAMQKVAYALNGPYTEIHQKSGKEMTTRLGLAKKAIEAMESVDLKSLSGKELVDFLMFRFELNIDLGFIDALENDLRDENVRKALPPPLLAQYQAMAAGALGDYERVDRSLKEIEVAMEGAVKFWTKEADMRRAVTIVAIKTMPGVQSGGAYPVAVALQTIPMLNLADEAVGQRNKTHNDRLNVMTLRGSLLVEAGETSRARVLFESILAEAGKEIFFTEHIIARRYLELLKAQGR